MVFRFEQKYIQWNYINLFYYIENILQLLKEGGGREWREW